MLLLIYICWKVRAGAGGRVSMCECVRGRETGRKSLLCFGFAGKNAADMSSVIFPNDKDKDNIDGEHIDLEGKKYKYKLLPLFHPNAGEGKKKVKAKVQVSSLSPKYSQDGAQSPPQPLVPCCPGELGERAAAAAAAAADPADKRPPLREADPHRPLLRA